LEYGAIDESLFRFIEDGYAIRTLRRIRDHVVRDYCLPRCGASGVDKCRRPCPPAWNKGYTFWLSFRIARWLIN